MSGVTEVLRTYAPVAHGVRVAYDVRARVLIEVLAHSGAKESIREDEAAALVVERQQVARGEQLRR